MSLLNSQHPPTVLTTDRPDSIKHRAPRVLLIDNYDSFVFNLARYLEELGMVTEVCRNDERSVDDILSHPPEACVLSPGPCTPSEAGICVELVQRSQGTLPILGVCLGHQAIGAALGGKVIRAPAPVHGRTSLIRHSGTGLFDGCPDPFPVARYHSLVVESSTLPPSLQVTARTEDGLIMALAHRHWPVFGVQFHPESILTANGHLLLLNFLRLCGVPVPDFSHRTELFGPVEAADDFYRREFDSSALRPS